MRIPCPTLNGFLAALALVATAALAFPLAAQEAPAPEPAPQETAAGQATAEERLLAELADPDQTEWRRVEADLVREWSRSGSSSMDLLLERGRSALEDGEVAVAIGHLTALTDHAPDFAEGWNLLASAYFRGRDYGPAIDAIAHALALNPKHYGALVGLGTMLKDMGYREPARDALRAAAAIHPHQPEIKAALEQLDRELAGQAL